MKVLRRRKSCDLGNQCLVFLSNPVHTVETELSLRLCFCLLPVCFPGDSVSGGRIVRGWVCTVQWRCPSPGWINNVNCGVYWGAAVWLCAWRPALCHTRMWWRGTVWSWTAHCWHSAMSCVVCWASEQTPSCDGERCKHAVSHPTSSLWAPLWSKQLSVSDST